MEDFYLCIGPEKLNKLFPFYIMLDSNRQLINLGKSLNKIAPEITIFDSFDDHFLIENYSGEAVDFEAITASYNQLFFIKVTSLDIVLRGRFEVFDDKMVFLGCPWFKSVEQVLDRKLCIDDFSNLNPLKDLIGVLTEEKLKNDELTQQLIHKELEVKRQKEENIELQRLSLVASNIGNAVMFTDTLGKIIWCNDAYYKMTGYKNTEVLGKTPIDTCKHPDSDKQVVKKIVSCFLNNEAYDLELFQTRKDGSGFWTRNIGQPVYDKNGKVVEYFSIIEDISEKKKYEEFLIHKQEKYRKILDNLNMGIAEFSVNLDFVYVNNKTLELSGYSQEELFSKKSIDFLAWPEDIKIIEEGIEKRKSGMSEFQEIDLLHKNGEVRNVIVSMAPQLDFDGNFIGTLGVFMDLTESKQQKQRLKLLSSIVEKNTNGVLVCDVEGKIEWVNESFVAMSGYNVEELLNRTPKEVLSGPETDPEVCGSIISQMLAGNPFKEEIIHYKKSGEKYFVRLSGQALFNDDNEIIKFFINMENISFQKALEIQREELITKLAMSNRELADYAHIVAHDLKSPIRAIYTLLGWIKEENYLNLHPNHLDYFSMIEDKVEKMDSLIDGVLTHSKIDKINICTEIVDLNQVMQNVLNLQNISGSKAVIIKRRLPEIKGDQFRLQQLFQNLIGNAIAHNDKQECIVEIDYSVVDKDIIFTIKDNGPGIAIENQKKIFDVFQSFSNGEKSTGLGLSIVKKIIESYGAEIWLESKMGEGTTFYVKFKNQQISGSSPRPNYAMSNLN